MGAKVLYCSLHKYVREGLSLDETYERSRRDYCDQCPDRSPHAAGWQYTHAWQLEQNERNKEFMDGPRGAPRKPMPPPPPIPMPGNTCAACGIEFGDTAHHGGAGIARPGSVSGRNVLIVTRNIPGPSDGHFQLSSSKRPGNGEALPVPANYRVIVSATGTVSVRGGRHTRSLHD